jgi:hypothetical protein
MARYRTPHSEPATKVPQKGSILCLVRLNVAGQENQAQYSDPTDASTAVLASVRVWDNTVALVLTVAETAAVG